MNRLRNLTFHQIAGWLLLLSLLAAQAVFSGAQERRWSIESSIGNAPNADLLTILSLGERRASAYGMMLYVQSFDAQAGQALRIRALDLKASYDWLESAMQLAPQQAYPLFLAARIYAESAPADVRLRMLELVYQQFFSAPNERWPWLAHAAYIARHEMNDSLLAIRYARAIREHALANSVPLWARELEIFMIAADQASKSGDAGR
jgi:hypothetical protein